MIAFATGQEPTFEQRLRDENGYLPRLIRKKAKLLCSERGYPASDVEDVAHDLFIHLWKRRNKFDSSRGKWTTFAYRALEGAMHDVVEKREAKKRKASRCPDSGVRQDETEHSPLARVACGDIRRHRGIRARPSDEEGDLNFDIAELLPRLPQRLRSRCLEFMEHGSIEEVARVTGDSKYSIRHDRDEILELVGEMELEDYRR